jgi:hypothetical protein
MIGLFVWNGSIIISPYLRYKTENSAATLHLQLLCGVAEILELLHIHTDKDWGWK